MRRGQRRLRMTIYQFDSSLSSVYAMGVFFLLAITSCVELLLSICQPSNVTGSQTEARTINKRIHDGAESQCHAFAYGIRLYIFHSTILIPNSLHTADTLRDIHTESQRYTQ